MLRSGRLKASEFPAICLFVCVVELCLTTPLPPRTHKPEHPTDAVETSAKVCA